MTLRPRYKVLILLAILAAGATGTMLWAGDDLTRPSDMKARLGALLEDLGPLAPIAYIGLYWVSPILFLPAIPMSLVGGFLFGPVLGGVYSLIGSTGGAAVSFLIGRAAGHDFVTKRAHGKVLAIKAGIEREGWRFVAFVRLVPILPFGVINLVLGTTDIGFWSYTITSLLAMAPGAFVYAYMGHAGRAAAEGARNLTWTFGIAVGLLVLLSGVPSAIRYARTRKRIDDVQQRKHRDPGHPADPAGGEAERISDR